MFCPGADRVEGLLNRGCGEGRPGSGRQQTQASCLHRGRSLHARIGCSCGVVQFFPLTHSDRLCGSSSPIRKRAPGPRGIAGRSCARGCAPGGRKTRRFAGRRKYGRGVGRGAMDSRERWETRLSGSWRVKPGLRKRRVFGASTSSSTMVVSGSRSRSFWLPASYERRKPKGVPRLHTLLRRKTGQCARKPFDPRRLAQMPATARTAWSGTVLACDASAIVGKKSVRLSSGLPGVLRRQRPAGGSARRRARAADAVHRSAGSGQR